MGAKLQFLGSGSSMGVPIIGCQCSVCASSIPQNQRLRTSALLHIGNKKILIDAGPDFRSQALKFQIDSLDGVILTHAHYDHIAGLDDLKVYYFKMKKKLPCLLSKETYEEIKLRYHYLMKPHVSETAVSTQLDFQLLDHNFGHTTFEGIDIHYVSYTQMGMRVHGFRIGDFAYITDIREYEERVIEKLKGVDTLVLSALRHTPSPAHLSLEEGIEFAKKVGVKQTFFTHLAHEVDHNQVSKELPKGFALAYDGLEIGFKGSQ